MGLAWLGCVPLPSLLSLLGNRIMAYTQKILKTETREINLRDIPFTEWPQEAKDAAEYFMRLHGTKTRFEQELFKKEWLAAKVENYLNTPSEDYL